MSVLAEIMICVQAKNNVRNYTERLFFMKELLKLQEKFAALNFLSFEDFNLFINFFFLKIKDFFIIII